MVIIRILQSDWFSLQYVAKQRMKWTHLDEWLGIHTPISVEAWYIWTCLFYLFGFGVRKLIYNFLYHCQSCLSRIKNKRVLKCYLEKWWAALMQLKTEKAHEQSSGCACRHWIQLFCKHLESFPVWLMR